MRRRCGRRTVFHAVTTMLVGLEIGAAVYGIVQCVDMLMQSFLITVTARVSSIKAHVVPQVTLT